MTSLEKNDTRSGMRTYDGLKHWFQFLAKTLPAAEQSFCNDWASTRAESITLATNVAGLVFHLVSLGTDPLFLQGSDDIATLRWVHLLMVAICGVVLGLLRPHQVRWAHWVAPIMAGSLVFYLYSIHQSLQDERDLSVVFAQGWTYFVVLGVIHILLLPSPGWKSPLGLAVFLWVGSALVWYATPYAGLVLPIAAMAFVLAALILMINTVRALAEARLEFRLRTERAQLDAEVLARELELAQRIQDSLTSPAQIQFHGLRAALYSRRIAKIGGDWSAMRVVGNHLFILVADAAGKGLQAALVIHAVQALWAGTLRDKTFDPEDWLTRVNQTLTQLGENQFHTVTLGILRVDSSGHAVYWSAGHLPVFLIEDGEVRRMHGQGTPLGLSYGLTIQTAEADLGKGRLSILIGTDGTFNRGALQRNHDIIAIRDAVRDHGASGLDTVSSDDDKTLIWIEQAPHSLPDLQRHQLRA